MTGNKRIQHVRRKRLIKHYISELTSKDVEVSEHYKFGNKYLGSFLVGYTKWLKDTLIENNIKKVFFFSRDGYLMEKALKIVDGTFETKYVHFSRQSIRCSLLHFCMSYEEVISLLPKKRYITTEYFLDFLGFSKEEQNVLAGRYSLNLEQNYKYEKMQQNAVFNNLYNALRDRVNLYSMEQDVLLDKYLRQIGMYGKCAIVDIGWNGSMQFYLEKYCKIKGIDVQLNGFYIGINPSWSIQGNLRGYLFYPGDLKLRKSLLCFLGGYERLFQNIEGSTYGYEECGGKIIPLLCQYEYEEDRCLQEAIKDMQDGGLHFLKEAYQRGIIIEDEVEWAKPLIKFGKYPTCKELHLFQGFYNLDGKKAYYISQKPLFKYGLNELKYTFNNSVWKTGFMKSLFKVPFPYYWIYFWYKK